MNESKVVLITGASKGIGKGTAKHFAENGYDVVINYNIDSNGANDTAKDVREAGRKEIVVQADVSDSKQVEELFRKTMEEFGRVDVLVNNAGVAPKIRKDILEASEESYDRVMTINLKGPYFLTQAISKWMIRLREQMRDAYQPYIINISSINRYTASVNRGEYCLSKSAMNMMTKLFGERLAEYGIPVYEISPGIIDTPMTEKVHDNYDKLISEGITPIRRWGKPIDIAKPVVAIVSGLLPYSTGLVLDIDGGFHLHRL